MVMHDAEHESFNEFLKKSMNEKIRVQVKFRKHFSALLEMLKEFNGKYNDYFRCINEVKYLRNLTYDSTWLVYSDL